MSEGRKARRFSSSLEKSSFFSPAPVPATLVVLESAVEEKAVVGSGAAAANASLRLSLIPTMLGRPGRCCRSEGRERPKQTEVGHAAACRRFSVFIRQTSPGGPPTGTWVFQRLKTGEEGGERPGTSVSSRDRFSLAISNCERRWRGNPAHIERGFQRGVDRVGGAMQTMAALKTYRSVEGTLTESLTESLTLVATMHKQNIDWFNEVPTFHLLQSVEGQKNPIHAPQVCSNLRTVLR
ncbi:hypothetical protein EYF80_028480 [Liparis tanakae]|uniref:Uncharacterized protein n=1 Tax=Liparis tanakae TaxID=230148 RepID=A0A4Z2H5X0_9TELE|nr:hypothetical protein EYF80_028480 [Liparis tanakae]